jgi:DNA-binding response OmpR family regulator
MKILIVEDEKYLARAIAEILKKNRYLVDISHDGEDGLALAKSEVYDIIILDIMLPKKDGLTIVKEVRASGIATPVIFLTAKGDVEDKVKGLDLGADDYLPKPFHMDELLSRIRALSRRKETYHSQGVIKYADLELDPSTLMLTCKKKNTLIKQKEAQILELLLLNKNNIISKNTIIEKIWGWDTEAEDNRVEIHISRLRKVLAKLGSKTSINVVRGMGYLLTDV